MPLVQFIADCYPRCKGDVVNVNEQDLKRFAKDAYKVLSETKETEPPVIKKPTPKK